MTDRASRFLDAFQEIEQHLRSAVLAPGSDDFTRVLAASLGVVPGASRYQHELRQFAMLRNAIVHRPNRGGEPIADPREDVVEQIEAIRAALLTTPTLISVLEHGVTVTSLDSPMSEASGRMLDGDYSQLPVLAEGRVADLLTTDAVARWMTTELRLHGRVRLETPVHDVVSFDSDRSFEVVDRSVNVLAALDLFTRHQERGEILHAIIVAKNLYGGALVAIATVTDLPALMAAAVAFRWSARDP